MAEPHFPSNQRVPSNWREIEQLVDDIADLTRQPVSAASFYSEVLSRTVQALGADGGFVWLRQADGRPRCLCQVGVSQTGDQVAIEHHTQFAQSAFEANQPTSITIDEDPTVVSSTGARCALFGPVTHDGEPVSLVEIVLPSADSHEVQENRRRVLDMICELAADFHDRSEARTLKRSRDGDRKLFDLVDRLHQSKGIDETAYRLANEGRRLLDCDRLSVLKVVRRDKCRVLSISGVDSVDQRSQLARRLTAFSNRVAQLREPVWFFGPTDERLPEVQHALESYLDVSHAKQLAAIPLLTTLDEQSNESDPDSIAVLVAENFDAERSDEILRQALMRLVRPATTALKSAFAHDNIPLVHLMERVGRLRWFYQRDHLPITILILVVLLSSLAGLVFVQADLTIEALGTLQPEVQRRVFSPEAGVVETLNVEHAQDVEKDELLLQLRKPELELNMTRVVGELQTAQQLLRAASAKRLALGSRGSSVSARLETNQLAAEEENLKQRVSNLSDQQAVVRQRLDALAIRSPIAGQVMTWDVAQRLNGRPVARGEELLTIVDPTGPWKLVLSVADQDIQHLLTARRQYPEPVVEYRLATQPQITYQGFVKRVAARSELNDHQQLTVNVTVAVDSSQVSLLRPGSEVVAGIHCGRRSIGYVWFHDVWEFAQRHFMFP